jgi:hypothetical protein
MRYPTLLLLGASYALGQAVSTPALARAEQTAAQSQPPNAPPAEGQPAEADSDELSGAPPPAAVGQGGYRGVVPGGTRVAPPHAPRRKTPIRVTWTGFQMKPEGGSRVFVQLTAEAPYQVTETAHGVQVSIKGARLHLRNNGRALETKFFATPVQKVRASEKGGQVTVLIETRAKSAHAERTESQGGYVFLLIDFPTDPGATETTATTNP